MRREQQRTETKTTHTLIYTPKNMRFAYRPVLQQKHNDDDGDDNKQKSKVNDANGF